ncbi:MAG: 4Fe-4S dicluster domain-containing protein [Deltaproteobacteria bacterium]|nr:4Fe-4S dicluster domain-containing protein [Deltaproteobacteria bacterium]
MGGKYAMVIDLERCMGCCTCVVACKVENNMEEGSGIRVETVGGPHRDTPAGEFPSLKMYYLPQPCMHCADPPCLEACPVEALYKREDGIVLVNKDECNGCRECLEACPYDALTLDSGEDKIEKCTLCAHRLDRGEEPFCSICCEAEAIYVGDLNDPESKVSQFITERGAYTLKPELGTGPAVYYYFPGSSQGLDQC